VAAAAVRKLPIAALTIGALLTLVLVRVVDLWWWRAQTLDTAAARASNIAAILAEYVRESFAAGDASLRQLAIHSRRVGGPSAPPDAWMPSLTSARAGLRNMGSISVVDRTGTIRYSTQPVIVGQSRASEYVFKRLSGQVEDELVVSTPFRTVIEPKTFVIPIGRRLLSASGAFDGIVVGAFLPATPRGFFRTADVGEHGVVSVIHPDGILLFREPAGQGAIGMPAAENAVFQAARRGDSDGLVAAPLAAGGPVYLSAFHAIASPPLVVTVSLDRNEVLAHWWHQVEGSIAFLGAIGALMGATLLTLFRQMDAKSNAERELAGTRQREAERLREANERLMAALALRDEFLMTVSHELRTPLNSITGWTRMLMAGGLKPARTRSALETIERNARAQTRLVDDLLDVSRAMTGKLRLDFHSLRLQDIVRNVLETSRPAADSKAIMISSEIESAVGPVSGDPQRLEQVVWNLMSNAIKFTPEGGCVRVMLQRDVRDPALVNLIVSDSGAGIEPEFLPHVFERFRQGDTGSKRRFGGLGLGLAIVRTLVELHGGTVTAESGGPGKGATFTVRLPLV
jgi:signal transduction histidine kinase